MARKKKQVVNTDVFGFNIKDFGEEQQREYLKRIAARANKRLQRIRYADIYSYAAERARKDLAVRGRKTFSSAKTLSPDQVLDEIMLIEAFLSHQTSLVSNVKKIRAKAFDKLSNRMKELYGTDISVIEDKTKFYRFLNSQEFKDIAKMVPSDQIIDDIAESMRDDKLTLEQIIDSYKEFSGKTRSLKEVKKARRNMIKSGSSKGKKSKK